MSSVRVATFNVHHCAGLDGTVDIHRVAQVIAITGADLVALQELDRGMERSGRVDQPAALARATGLVVDFHPTLERDDGEYGLALASREAIAARFESLPRIADEEPRGVLVAEWRGITVIATHLSLRGAVRVRQTAALVDLARGLSGPRLLMGDLNQGPWSLRAAARDVFDVPLWPRRTLARRWSQRDHILGGGGARVTGRRVHRTTASDHYAVSADVGLC